MFCTIVPNYCVLPIAKSCVFLFPVHSDLGEYLACTKLGIVINEKVNEKGIDAKHPTNELTFEIKTRRRD
jgi:hypothetical protein